MPKTSNNSAGGPRLPLRPASARRGFSLIEVVVAVGIFAVAISIVIGLLAPTAKSVAETIDTNTANRVTSAINSKLQSLGYTTVQTKLFTSTFSPDTVAIAPTPDTKLLFANKAGDKVGDVNDPIWGGPNNHAEKFFEVMLIRTPSAVLSATDSATTTNASFVVFTVRLTWPAYLPDSSGLPTTTVPPTPHAQRSVFLFNAAVAR